MPRDYKSIWQDAYNSAIEEGKSEYDAIKVAEDAVEEYLSEDLDESISRKSR